MSEAAVKTAVYRLRRQYRRLLRAEIAQTVSSPEQVEDEIRHLFDAFEGGRSDFVLPFAPLALGTGGIGQEGAAMTEIHRCLQCGAELARNVAQGLCPKCLLKAGLGHRTDISGSESASSPLDPPPTHRDAVPEVNRQFGLKIGAKVVTHARYVALCGLMSFMALTVLGLMGTPAMAAEADAAAKEEAEKAAQVFQSLYGEELKRVAATRDVGDDLALAAKLLGAARAAESQPALLAVLCETSFDLAAEDPKGCETALAAAELLARKTPERAQALQERVLSVRQRQYSAGRGDARSTAGEALIKCLADVAAARTAVGAFEEAARFYRQALTVARAIRSASAEWIGSQMKRLGEQQRLAANLPRLVANVKANPDNREARGKLIRLLVVDLDNPAEAAKYLDDACDPLLCKYVPAAAKPVEAAPEAACMEMADWYRELAAPAVPGSKVAMCVRAREYYERFLDLHPAADIDRTKVELALKKVDEDLKALGWTQPPGPWIDVLKITTADNLRTWGDFKRTEAGVVSGPKELCRASLPIHPVGNYELEVKLTRVTGGQMGIAIPVGNTMPVVALKDKVSGIQLIRGKKVDDNETKTSAAAIRNGLPITVGVKVLLDGDKATISVTLDGKPYINWTGPQSALSTEKWGEMPGKGAVGLSSYMSNVVCSGVRLRMLSGKAMTRN